MRQEARASRSGQPLESEREATSATRRSTRLWPNRLALRVKARVLTLGISCCSRFRSLPRRLCSTAISIHPQDHPERLDLLLSLASTNPELPFAPLVK